MMHKVRARSRLPPILLIWFLTLQFAVYVMKRKRIISHGQTMQFEVNELETMIETMRRQPNATTNRSRSCARKKLITPTEADVV